ncbi:Transducin/WD40 repeat-like superfamily protein [Euphorbia peplus]|nr:Transducin/WD40 repeat-like superfamily protein [Euphorbia peplus]
MENNREEREDFYDISSEFSENCSSSDELLLSEYELWVKEPESVEDRRSRFLKSMGLSLDRNAGGSEESSDECVSEIQVGIDRLMDSGGAVLRNSGGSEDGDSRFSIQSVESFEGVRDEDSGVYKFRNLDDGTEFVVDEIGRDGLLSRLHEVGSNQSFSFDEFQRVINGAASPLVQQLMNVEAKKKAKKTWLKKLRRLSNPAKSLEKSSDYELNVGSKIQRVKVHSSKKKSKELSSLYAGQEFLAHKGSILTMKFSLDGQYLATGGEDCIVRVWKVIEDDTLDQFHMSANDISCLYFTMNQQYKIASLDVDRIKVEKKKHISSDSTCVIFPPKVFKVEEKPLHEFHGHNGDILDLSWSKKRFLLSSSIDHTVRLWQVGCNRCQRVFSHNNYVTCVDFNPVDDNYFISGSIDGKVRIWEVDGCQVVDYTILREIVTAVCYYPDGKGGIVGTMTGNCLFYDIIDNRLELNAQISLQGKKKLAGKRITGFEFSPSDPSKVVVTSADSLVRILCGMDVICKFKASSIGVGANQMNASFTSDGKHVVSTNEDSNVYIWNYTNQEKSPRKKTIQSYENFTSHNASIAVAWRGIENESSTETSKSGTDHQKLLEELDDETVLSSQDCFSHTRAFLWDSLTRGTATWPEEKLPDCPPIAVSPNRFKSEFKFLKNACNSMFNSPHLWGLVVVTAGWDGRIRTYLNYGLPLRL